MAAITRRGGQLALLQIIQTISGVLAQMVLLLRWSSDPQTDASLVLNSTIVLIASLLLFGGLEMALPAALERSADRQCLLDQTLTLSFLLGVIGMFIAVMSLQTPTGILFAAQIPAMALGSFWRGVLLAQDQLFALRLSLLIGSTSLVIMFALFSGAPLLVLPLMTLTGTVLTALVAWYFAAQPVRPRSPLPLSRELRRLLWVLVALALAAFLVNFQALIERLAVAPLGTGFVAAFNTATRGWDALLSMVVAAAVLPHYANWAQHRESFHQSLRHTAILSILIVAATGLTLWVIHPILTPSLARAVEIALYLLPRTFLLMSLQPLSLWFHARGQSWRPAIASFCGILILLGGLPFVTNLSTLMLVTTASGLVGWGVLSWRVF